MTSFFSLIGAFTLWALSGFKGKYESHLGEISDNKPAVVGLVSVIAGLFLLIFLVRAIG